MTNRMFLSNNNLSINILCSPCYDFRSSRTFYNHAFLSLFLRQQVTTLTVRLLDVWTDCLPVMCLCFCMCVSVCVGSCVCSYFVVLDGNTFAHLISCISFSGKGNYLFGPTNNINIHIDRLLCSSVIVLLVVTGFSALRFYSVHRAK